MKKTNKLVLELEKNLHDLHECINKDKIDVMQVKGYIDYISHVGSAILVISQIKLQKNRLKHARRVQLGK